MKKLMVVIVGLLGLGFVLKRAQGLDGSQRIVCGTNSQNEIWCTSYAGMEHGRWERLHGSLKQVLVRGGQLWGVAADGRIFYSPDFRNPSWVQLHGSAKEISEGHGLLCIVDNKDEVYCADKGITTPEPDWKKAPAGAQLKFVSIN
jgi:hypothetical protein